MAEVGCQEEDYDNIHFSTIIIGSPTKPCVEKLA